MRCGEVQRLVERSPARSRILPVNGWNGWKADWIVCA